MVKIDGACSNQIVKCIIFSNIIEVGMEKLLEIEEEKNLLGITTVQKRIAKNRWISSEIKFSDGEEWIVVKPIDRCRGYRWRKAWVDVKVSVDQLQNFILPMGCYYQWEQEKYFNWDKY